MSKQKRVFIIHGWGGNPEEGNFPWLKSELQKKGFKVYNPPMPEPLNPQIDAWVNFLKQQIGVPNNKTILFGHSIGAQAILRYLETLSEKEHVGGAVFLAGWTHLTDEAFEDDDDKYIAKPWLETPLNWIKIKSRAGKFVAIFSDDDPLVPISDAKIFESNLGAKIIIERGKGHFGDGSGVKELPSALEAVLEISEKRINMVKKVLGVIAIIIGIFSLITPFTPGSWLIFVGLGMLGFRLLFWKKIKKRFFGKHKQEAESDRQKRG